MEIENNKKQKLSRVDRRPRGLTPLNDSAYDPNDLTSSDEIIFRREDIPSDILNKDQNMPSNDIIQDGNKTFALKRVVKDNKTEKDGLGEFCKSTVQGSIQAIAVKVVTGALLVTLCGLGINLGTSTNSSNSQPTVNKSSQFSKSAENNGKNNTNNKKAKNSSSSDLNSSDSNKESNIPIKEKDTTSNIQNEDNSTTTSTQSSQTSNDSSTENNESTNSNTNTSSNTTQNTQENNQDIKTDTSSQTNSNTTTDSSSQTNQGNSNPNISDKTE